MDVFGVTFLSCSTYRYINVHAEAVVLKCLETARHCKKNCI